MWLECLPAESGIVSNQPVEYRVHTEVAQAPRWVYKSCSLLSLAKAISLSREALFGWGRRKDG